jgi:hypothetical protein
MSEAKVQQVIRIRTSQLGWRMWRNNVGVLRDERGVPVRYGLANESTAVNKQIKSSDLIGIRPMLITPEMVGTVIGQFVSIEVKREGWHYTGTDREVAQLRWLEMVRALGGYAQFSTGDIDIDTVVNKNDNAAPITPAKE